MIFAAAPDGVGVKKPERRRCCAGREIDKDGWLLFTKPFDEVDGGVEVTVKEVHRAETEGLTELEVEMVNARRAMRTATWGIVFCKKPSLEMSIL